MKIKRYLFLVGPVLALLLLLGSLQPKPAQALDRPVTQRVMKTVVQIYALEEDQGELWIKWTGSGTIITPDGLILTNCHVALPRAMWDYPEFDYDFLGIGMTIRSDEPPTPTYLAQVVQYDPDLDLAVIQVTHTLDGNPVDPDDLNLPYLDLGDSDELEIGDTVTIFGYPGIGGETITLTSGNVSGFSRERGVEGRAWIKTDATIAGGNSGGTAVDDDGILIGVPTQGGAGSADQIVDCRYIADTNGDGVIDEDDTCVPMGGFINALRPVNLAKPLINAALGGLGPQPLPDPDPQPQPTGDAAVSRLLFTPAVNAYDQPVTVVYSFPSGATEIYLVFDYEEFQDGISWQPVLTYEGETYTDLWPVSGWNGGLAGTWWISIWNDEGLADGEYEFDLYYDGAVIGSASVEVGGPESNAPTFSDVRFLYYGGEGGYVLPAGVNEVAAEFDYENMSAAVRWSNIWYLNGREVAGGDGRELSDPSGTTSVLLSNAPGRLDSGAYRLEIYIEGDLAATSDFVIGEATGGAPGGDLFGPITFAQGVDRNDKPVGAGTSFESGLSDLFAFFDYQGMQDGWDWTQQWSINGEVVLNIEDDWAGGGSGSWWVSVYSDDGLPDGVYQLDLLLEGQLLQSGACTIGDPTIEPASTPEPPVDGVEIFGHIIDADNGNGIQGALILFLMPDETIDTFEWTEEEVYSMGETDRDGYYELDMPLVVGETYSVLIGAYGYISIMEDGILIPEDLESPYQLDIALQQQ